MRIVVDPGALSKPGHPENLESKLAASPENKVVLTDFAFAEAFNGANAARLKRTFGVMARHPEQIEVLKPTPVISRIRPRREGLAERFVDEVETNRFRVFCHDLHTNAVTIDARIAETAVNAGKRVGDLLRSADQVRADMQGRITQLPSEDLKALRQNNRVTTALADLVTHMVTEQTIVLFREFSGIEEMPDPRDAVYSFPLRFALANLVLNLEWGTKGGLDGAKPEKIRNDVTDMTYVAYATLYDDLITNDQKMAAIHRNTLILLKTLFPLAD